MAYDKSPKKMKNNVRSCDWRMPDPGREDRIREHQARVNRELAEVKAQEAAERAAERAEQKLKAFYRQPLKVRSCQVTRTIREFLSGSS